MADLFAVAIGGMLGIIGTIAGVALNHALQRRDRRDDDRLNRELAHLNAVESEFKRLSERLITELFVPIPFAAYRTIAPLRELMYLSPAGLEPTVVNRMLELYDKAANQRSMVALARRWILGDVAEVKALAVEIAEAEAAVAKAIADRRVRLLNAGSLRP